MELSKVPNYSNIFVYYCSLWTTDLQFVREQKKLKRKLIYWREDLRLTFLYKVVGGKAGVSALIGGLVPATPPEKYLTPQKTSRNIRPPNRPDYVVQNPVHNQSRNLYIPRYNTEQYKQSFFPRTIIAWNKHSPSQLHRSLRVGSGSGQVPMSSTYAAHPTPSQSTSDNWYNHGT